MSSSRPGLAAPLTKAACVAAVYSSFSRTPGRVASTFARAMRSPALAAQAIAASSS